MTAALLTPQAFMNKQTFGEPKLHTDGEVIACHDPLLEISTANLEGWAHERAAKTLMGARLLDERGEPSAPKSHESRELEQSCGQIGCSKDFRRANRVGERKI